MKSDDPKFITMSSAQEETARLKNAHTAVRNSMTTEQLDLSNIVEIEVAKHSAVLDTQFEEEKKLRKWAENLCGVALDMSEIENLTTVCKNVEPKSVFLFKPIRSVNVITFYKTPFNTIDRLDRYVDVLERALIDVTNSSQFTALSFSGLIKLAFQRLFNRSK